MLSLDIKCTGKRHYVRLLLSACSVHCRVMSTDCHQCAAAKSQTEAAPDITTCVREGGKGDCVCDHLLAFNIHAGLSSYL